MNYTAGDLNTPSAQDKQFECFTAANIYRILSNKPKIWTITDWDSPYLLLDSSCRILCKCPNCIENF